MCGIGLVLTAFHSPPSTCITAPSSSSSDHQFDINSYNPTAFEHNFQQRLCQRGPDYYSHQLHRLAATSTRDNGFLLAMHTAVLHLRGNQLIHQPLLDSDENVLCWNGEIFGLNGRDPSSLGDTEDDDDEILHGNDTVMLSKKLQLAGQSMTQTTTKEVVDPVVEVLRRVRGPFAVIWFHVNSQRVYFAHDRFGRRSLLYKSWGTGRIDDMIRQLAQTKSALSTTFCHSDVTRFVLSNVAIEDTDQDLMQQYQELPASGIFVMDLQAVDALRNDTEPSYKMEFHPYAPIVSSLPPPMPHTDASNYVLDRYGCRFPCPSMTTHTDLATKMLESSGRALLLALSNAVGVRVRSIPLRPLLNGQDSTARIAVLFSGGLDSVVLAALTHFHASASEPVDLLTVCFDESSNHASPDRLAAQLAHAELCTLFPKRQWNLIKVNVSRVELSREQREIQTLMAPCDTHMDFNIGAAFWFLSRGRGVLTKSTQASEVATLEELNAFLKPQQGDMRYLGANMAAFSLFDSQNANASALLCPARCCGRKRKHGCLLQVCKTCCFKIQRAVNRFVPLQSQHVDEREIQSSRVKLIAMGISEAQLDRFLDLANQQDEEASQTLPAQQRFSCCVHRLKQTPLPAFSYSPSASTATTCTSSSPSPMYETSARVLLLGIGADEQLAGYGRHRTTLITKGEQALQRELQKDLHRLWKRNLGRDDRCIAAHGREARFPYLDETLVSTIATFPVSSLCTPDFPRGVGEKRVLRYVANTFLGLTTCTGLAKRAIQFGSRIAKVSNPGSSNRQTHGKNKFASGI